MTMKMGKENEPAEVLARASAKVPADSNDLLKTINIHIVTCQVLYRPALQMRAVARTM